MSEADFLTSILDVLARSASAPSLRASLEAASRAFQHLVRIDGAGLLLADSTSRAAELWTAGMDAAPERLTPDAALARPYDGAFAASRDALDCDASRAILLSRGHASVLVLPLRVETRRLGALLLFGDEPEAFAAVDAGRLLAGAAIVAIAIRHVRERLALERRAAELGRARPAAPPKAVARPAGRGGDPLRTLADIERDAIADVLAHTRGRVSGPRGAAMILGMKPTTLQSRMKKLGVPRRA